MLKQQYDITSQAAFNYLRCQDNYETLRQQTIREGARNVPFSSELANVCNNVKELTKEALKATEIEERLKKGRVTKRFYYHINGFNHEITHEKSEEDCGNINWPRAVKNYLQFQNSDWEETTRAYFDFLINEIDNSLEEARNKSIKLELPGTIMEDYSRRTLREIGLWINRFQDIPFFIPHGLISPKETSEEEMELLYGADRTMGDVSFENSHYERAERERSLGRLEVERKIAIQALSPEISKSKKHNTTIQRAIEGYLNNKEEELSDLRKEHTRISQEEGNTIDEMLRKEKYLRLAVKKNRNFLERFFSN
tara:strand:- start:195 stop:1127 length:933 start_codon:yes stop_codon:yes gene_type:complete